MNGFLETIVERRRRRLALSKLETPAAALRAQLGRCAPPADFASEIRETPGFLVAEIKRASPSRGLIAPDVDPAARARAYRRGGADAVSVLCEPDYFKGSFQDLATVARAVSLPVLCKDFVVDPYQLLRARAAGADWVLLIVRVLGGELPEMVERALLLGLEPLVEVHSEREMEGALDAGARVIGVNARDLETFRVDREEAKRLITLCPRRCACIAESGIRDAEDLLALRESGAHGFLVGETLMRHPNPEFLLRSFRAALIEQGALRAVQP